MKHVIFCWSGFPQYAARLVGAFVKAHPEVAVKVVATRPGVPVEGMERLCGCPVEWLEREGSRGFEAFEKFGRETVAFVTGWHVEGFMRICAAVRTAGGRAVCMIDNNYDEKEGLRSWMGKVRFRLCKRGMFDGFVVPGKSGRKLMRYWGVEDSLVQEGMYSADASLFTDGGPLAARPKRILYVGQFSVRKNVARLVAAFRRAAPEGWELHLFGCGPVKVEPGRGVVVHPFAQPEQLAGEYRQARIFCLPSVEEHWGLVVHEAALSGCVLALSERVGAVDDLLGDRNGFSFNPYSEESIEETLRRVMTMTDDELAAARGESLALAKERGVAAFVNGIERHVFDII